MKIYIFNLETNLDSAVLSAAHDWIEAFAQNFDQVHVYSTHVGKVDLPSNVKVEELGGGSIQNRIFAILKLSAAFVKIVATRKSSVVFHHMSPRTAVLIGPFLRLTGVTQGLWYSHNHASPSLLLATPVVNWIFSTNQQALPIQSKKTQFVGHAIKTERFNKTDLSRPRNPLSIISVGRIVPVKHLEGIIEIAELSRTKDVEVGDITLIGPQPDQKYLRHLQSIFAEANLTLYVKPPVKYDQLLGYLENHDYFFTGTPKSVDKAAIEAAIAGCFVVSENTSALESTGMYEVWKSLACPPPERISEQIRVLSRINQNEIPELRKVLQSAAISQNDLYQTISMISKTLIGNGTN